MAATATLIQSFAAVTLLLCLVNKGYCKCSIDGGLTIGNIRTGREIQGKGEWTVTVYNNCKCPQSQITLRNLDFETVKPVDPAILEKVGDKEWLLIKGNPLPVSGHVSFSYAWDVPSNFVPISSTAPC